MEEKEIYYQKIKRDNNFRLTIVIIGFIFCLILWYLGAVPSLKPILFIVSICALSITITYTLLSKGIANKYLDYGVSSCDYFLISATIYFTGGIDSPFHLIYIITILIEVMDLVDKKHMIFDIVVSIFSYALVIIIAHYHDLNRLLIYHLVSREALILVAGIIALQYANMIISKGEEVRRANEEKVNTIQELAAGVLHEIRNPLAGIKLLASGLLREVKGESSQKEYLEEILKEVDKLSNFSVEFLNFARPFELKIREVDLEDLIEETLFIFSPKFSPNIKIKKEIFPHLKIMGDKEKIQEVLFNLLNNALEAINGDGKIEIKVKPISLTNLAIEITDNGCGISKENLENIFKPFFTMKEEGTGLGLSICKKIVEAHKGNLMVKSKEGVGTTFSVILPMKV